MRSVTCDGCKKVETVSSGMANGKNWSRITVNAVLIEVNEKSNMAGLKRLALQKDFCVDCTKKTFDFSFEPKKTLQEQFTDAADDWLRDLAIDAIQDAQDNM